MMKENQLVSFFCSSAMKNYSKSGLVHIAPYYKKENMSIRIRKKGDEKFSFIELRNGMKTKEDIDETQKVLEHYLYEL